MANYFPAQFEKICKGENVILEHGDILVFSLLSQELIGTGGTLFGRPIISIDKGYLIFDHCEYCKTKETPKNGRCSKCGAPL